MALYQLEERDPADYVYQSNGISEDNQMPHSESSEFKRETRDKVPFSYIIICSESAGWRASYS